MTMKYSLILCAVISSSAFGMQTEIPHEDFQDMPYKQFITLWNDNIAARKEFYEKHRHRNEDLKNPELQKEIANLEGILRAIMKANMITHDMVRLPNF